MRASAQLRALMQRRKTIIAPGCYNALSAKVLELDRLSGALHDRLWDRTGAAGHARRRPCHHGRDAAERPLIANAVRAPVIADADNGYGNAINVMRTVREYIQTGVAAIHLEDQVMPKRCGHVAGRRVVAMDEAVGKIRAADKVRRDEDPDFVLIARTDARGAVGGSLDEAIKRANAYLEAGADVAFVEGPVNTARWNASAARSKAECCTTWPGFRHA